MFVFNILKISFDWLTVGKEFWARQAGARGILFKNLCGVCAACFKKPLYPILDQNIRFPPPYFRSDPKIDNLFQTTLYPGTASVCLKINKGLIFLTYTSQGVHDKNDTNSFFQMLLTRVTREHKPYPISDQNGNNLYPISDQKGSKTIPFGLGATHTYIAYVRG